MSSMSGNERNGRPKTPTSERKIWLDGETVRLLREHRAAQLKARMQAGPVRRDNDLVFCQHDGTLWKPDYITRRFKKLAA